MRYECEATISVSADSPTEAVEKAKQIRDLGEGAIRFGNPHDIRIEPLFIRGIKERGE